MNTKKTFGKRILSGLLAATMFVTMVPLPVFSEDSAVNVKLSELNEKYENDGVEILYPYYYQLDTNKDTFTENDSIEFDRRDSSNTNFSAKVYHEGRQVDVIDKDTDYKTVLPEGEWLLSSFTVTTTSGEIRFVHRYVDPTVYVFKTSSNTIELSIGDADSNGMAVATFAESDELYDFFSGLDIKVRKTVDKIEAGSFCIYVKGKNGEDYTDFFEYYDSALANIFWQRGKWLNAYDSCLGSIEDDEVQIYIKPNYDLLHVKTSVVGGKGGSISSADTYYEADSTEEQTYTVTPDAGYEVEDLEVINADGNPVTADFDKSTGKLTITPKDLRKADEIFSVAEIKVTFSKKHEAHCICGGTTDFDGHDTHANIDWQAWKSTDSLPTTAGNYYLKNNVILPNNTYDLPDGVNICLNGYSITGEDADHSLINVDGTLGITDCDATGASGSIGNLGVIDLSKLIMYSGKIENSNVHINGGSEFTMTGTAVNDGTLYIHNVAKFTMNGNAINNNIIMLKETYEEAIITFSGHANGGNVDAEDALYSGLQISGNAKITKLSGKDANYDSFSLTMEGDAEISDAADIGFSSLSLSGNAKLGAVYSSYTIYDERASVLKDNAQIFGMVKCNDPNLTIQDSASITGKLTVNGSKASRVSMKGNSAINGSLISNNASASFEMQDNATIGTIDVGTSTVYGTVTCTDNIESGVFNENGTVINNGTIYGGIFYGTVSGNGTIAGSATVDVVFKTNGGNAVDTQEVLRGQKAVAPANFRKSGYTFDGWYKNDTVYDFTEPVIEDLTLTAQWTANTYTVSFDSDGGTAIGDKTLGWNDKVLDGIESPTRSNGYEFDGWKCGGISIDANTTYADLAADDTIAIITLTAQWRDIEKPTGEITLGENSWNSFLNDITFGLFFKETKTVTITAADNSGKTVQIEYLLSDKEMSLSELENATFTVYTDTFSIAPDNNYVIYVRLTDEAGNAEYISSEGFVIDKTAPVIEGYKDGQTVNICGSKLLTFIETNLDSVTMNDYPLSITMGKYATLSYSDSAQVVVATDKAGNTTTVTFNIAKNHDFNFETKKCNHCGQNALVELTVDGVTKLYDSYSRAAEALSYDFANAELKLLGDDITERSFSHFSDGKLVFDLNGFTFNKGSGEFYVTRDFDMTITGGGTMNGQIYVMNGGTLTVDNGNGEVKNIWQSSGNLKVTSGNIYKLIIGANRRDTATERKTELCGGTYAILMASFDGITCADLLGKGYRFDGISYTDAQKDELDEVTVIPCNHESYDENDACIGCGKQMEAAIERNGVTTKYKTLTDALNAAENGDTLILLTDVDAGDGVTIQNKNITFDLNGKRLYSDKEYKYILDADYSTVTVKNGTVDAVGVGTGAIKLTGDNIHMTLENVTAKVNSKASNGSVFICNSWADDNSTVVIKSGDYQGLNIQSKTVRVTLEGGTYRPYNKEENKPEANSIYYKIDVSTDDSSCDCMTLLGDGCSYVDENGNPVRTFGGFDTVVSVRKDVTVPTEPVAKIGDTEYPSLREAIDAANVGDTITLLRDLDLGNGLVLLGEKVYKNFTLDLDNHTISANGAYLLYMEEQGAAINLTIKNGTLDGSKCSKYNGVIFIRGGNENSWQNVTLKDVTAEGGTVFDYFTGKYEPTPVVHVGSNSTVIFDGGTYTGGVSISRGTAVLKNGTFKKGENTYSIKTEDTGKYLSDYLDEDCQFWDGDNILDLSSETQTDDVIVHPCEHIWVDGKCTVCQKVCDHGMAEDGSMTASVCPVCKMAAVAEVDTEPVKYFLDFDKALDCAMANAGSTLKLLADIAEDITVTSGTFTLDATDRTIDGNLNVESGAELTVNIGTVNKNTVCAKGGKLTADGTSFKGTLDCIGEGGFTFCTFTSAFTGTGEIYATNCQFDSTLKVSNKFYSMSSIFNGEITVENNGKLDLQGVSQAGNILIKSGGEASFMHDGNYSGVVTAESGSTLEISGGTFNSVEIGENVDVTLSGGSFGTVKVSGKQLIDCLAEEIDEGRGYAFVDKDGNVVDGRVNSLTDVTIIDNHVHDCVWDKITHEKRCACGYVSETDTEAPVISGIEDGKTYYSAIDFTVTDDNDFTVFIDGTPVQSQLGVWTLTPDNNKHTISVTDVAGNTVSVSVTVFKIYNITLPSGEGYTVTGADTAGHGTEYEFTVKIADGYSKTKSYRVLANGKALDSAMGDENSDTFLIDSVDSDTVITVEGVVDITAPNVEIEISTDNFKSFMNTVTFGLFFKETQTVTVTASDMGSGIKTVEYLLSETVFNDPGSVTGEWITMTLENGKAQFSLEPNHKAYIYVRVIDKSGNIQIINSEGVVVYTDSEAITEAVDFTMRDSNDVSFDVKLNGNTVSALYNGDTLIDSGNYTVSEGGTVTLKSAYLNTLAAGEYTIRVAYNPMGESYKNGDEPAMTSLKLTVGKRTALIDHNTSDKKYYDGKPIPEPSYKTDSDGAVIFEYKLTGADDLTYITAAPKNVGNYTIRITIAETDTFKAVSSTMTFEIVPKEVTIIDTAVLPSKVYDGTTDIKLTSAGTLSGVVDGDDVAIVTGKASYSDKSVGKDKTVTFTDFALSGADVANYKLISQPASVTADITAKEVTIIGTTVESSKVYDGTTDAKITSAGTLINTVDGDDVTFVTGKARYNNKNVGAGKAVLFTDFALSGKDASNYELTAQPESKTADITAKEVTIIGTAVEASKVYDGTTDIKITATGTLNGVVDGDDVAIVTGKASYSDKNVGTDKTVTFTDFALSGADAENYKLTAQPANTTADITAKEVTIIGTTVETSKVYDGTTDIKITATVTLSGVTDGDDVAIVSGKASYSDKNVGTGKTVTFTDFALSGKDAANYAVVQPESTTASISAKELTIENLKVKDKQCDGNNTAEIDGTPTLAGVVEGDILELVNGIPTFDSVSVGKDIPIHFTLFTLSGDSTTVGNYTLVQPTGITASISEYIADGSEYSVNSNDWINTDFVITANEGYQLSLNDSPNGEWTDKLTASEETDNGELIFYVKNTATGVISMAVTENYKIDKTAPTGEVTLNERTAFEEFIHTITFGLFFSEDVNVKLTAADDASGIKSVMYYKSDKALTEEEIREITDWTDNSDFNIEAKDKDKFIIYVRIEDNAGNITYISSDGAIFDTTAPKLTSVENGKTYYVTKRVTVEDENIEAVTLNGEPVENEFTLTGDADATYIIRAVDKAGNVTEYTVYMKPISSVTDAVADLTDDNVKSSDSDTVSSVESRILDIIGELDDSAATEDEQNKLNEANEKCKSLNERISEVADEIKRIRDDADSSDIDKVTSADKAGIEKLIEDIDDLLSTDNLTDTERKDLEALRDKEKSLLDRIDEVKNAADDEKIAAVDTINKDNVKYDDKDALEDAKKALEDALRDFGDNYTDEESKDLEEKLKNVKEPLDAIDNAEKAAEEVDKLPSVDDVKLDDKKEIERVKEIIAGLTENEKAMLGKEAISKINALEEKLRKLAEQTDSPETGYTSDFALLIALAFISGGVATGTAVISKKKKNSVR